MRYHATRNPLLHDGRGWEVSVSKADQLTTPHISTSEMVDAKQSSANGYLALLSLKRSESLLVSVAEGAATMTNDT